MIMIQKADKVLCYQYDHWLLGKEYVEIFFTIKKNKPCEYSLPVDMSKEK